MSKNNAIHITYIGRLVPEKGICLVIDCIKKGRERGYNIVWHICGDGIYMEQFRELEKYEKSDINIYGHVDRQKIDVVLDMTDLVIMPSLFLETFGLVALDTLERWVPVCWFARGGLSRFIHPSLILDRENPVDSFFHILDTWVFPLQDISSLSYDIWIEQLSVLTDGIDRILLISDYTSLVGWAEQYLSDITLALRSIGKEVDIYGYAWHATRMMRIWLMCLSPFAFWRGILLDKKIKQYKPDLIWMQGVLRYIWPYGARAISHYHWRKYITHHDLGLITPYPSRIYSEWDIPLTPSIGDWISHSSIHIFTVLALISKWFSISSIWYYLNSDNITHIIPSVWMESYFRCYTTQTIIVFPHTSQNSKPVK